MKKVFFFSLGVKFSPCWLFENRETISPTSSIGTSRHNRRYYSISIACNVREREGRRRLKVNNKCSSDFHAMFFLCQVSSWVKLINENRAPLRNLLSFSFDKTPTRFLMLSNIFLPSAPTLISIFITLWFMIPTVFPKWRKKNNFGNSKLTLKSDNDAIKSSSSFVAVDALCDPCKAGDEWLSELCDRAIKLKLNKINKNRMSHSVEIYYEFVHGQSSFSLRADV